MPISNSFSIPTGVSSRELGASLLIANLDSGSYHELNEAARLVWNRLAAGGSPAAACDDLCREFDVDRATAERDVAALIAALSAKGLLQPDAA